MTQITYTATAVTDCGSPWIHIDQDVTTLNGEGKPIKRNIRRICDISRNHVTDQFVIKMGHNVWESHDLNDIGFILTHLSHVVRTMNKDNGKVIENALKHLNDNVLPVYNN